MSHASRKVEPIQVRAPMDAPGVTYAANSSAPGLKLFPCSRLRATMSQGGCAKRWATAQVAKGQQAEAFEACRSCAIGASHAGLAHVHHSPFYGAAICPRCEEGNTRIIGGRLCINCYNRERELLAGRNARGNRPRYVSAEAPLRSLDLRISINGRARRERIERVTGTREVVLQRLRATRGQVAFAHAGSSAGLRQGRLL